MSWQSSSSCIAQTGNVDQWCTKLVLVYTEVEGDQRRIQDFLEGGANPKGTNLLFGLIYAENCMEMKKNGLVYESVNKKLLNLQARAYSPH